MSGHSATALPARDRRQFLVFANALADQARALLGTYAPGAVAVSVKADGSYVSEADTGIEAAWREAIGRRFPDHGLIGEEYPAEGAGRPWQWVLDPIDGTDNFIHGISTFGTLVSLRHEGQAVLGVIDHPRLDVRFSGAIGLGVTRNNVPIVIGERHEAGPPIVVTTAAENFAAQGRMDAFCAVTRRFPNIRIYRDCFAHGLVLAGSAAAMLDFHVRLWDVSAAEALVCEAGGLFMGLDGPAERYQVVFGRPQTVREIAAILHH